MAGEALYYQRFKSKTAAGGRGKWFKSFSKFRSPLACFGGCGFPRPELFAINAPRGTTAPQKGSGAPEGMKPSPLAACSTLPLTSGGILQGCNGRIKYKQESASGSGGEGRVGGPSRQLQQGLIYRRVQ